MLPSRAILISSQTTQAFATFVGRVITGTNFFDVIYYSRLPVPSFSMCKVLREPGVFQANLYPSASWKSSRTCLVVRWFSKPFFVVLKALFLKSGLTTAKNIMGRHMRRSFAKRSRHLLKSSKYFILCGCRSMSKNYLRGKATTNRTKRTRN